MKPTPLKNDTLALRHARHALSLMVERSIEPTPVNYAVWYHYVAEDKKELNLEINKILGKKTLHLSDDVSIYLYNKYVINEARKDAAATEAASQNTQAVLAEIMGVIDKFSGDTQTYNQQIDEQVNELSSKIADPTLKEMAKIIVSRAVAIRESGDALNSKLEASRREVEELKVNLEQVTNEAQRDFLTGAANRKALEAKLEELVAYATAHNSDLCLLMVDIDHFKQINDKFGHPVGDEVLRQVGRTLFESVKGKDFVARYGGEEFAVLLPATSLATGLIVAENIRKNIAETELVSRDSSEPISAVTISIGVARFRPGDDSIALLISRADGALYRSKMGGRNRVTPESF